MHLHICPIVIELLLHIMFVLFILGYMSMIGEVTDVQMFSRVLPTKDLTEITGVGESTFYFG